MLILNNLQKLSDLGYTLDIRIPIINEVNTDDLEIEAIIKFLKENIQAKCITLLPYHDIGTDKYHRLGLDTPTGFSAPSSKKTEHIIKRFKNNGLPIRSVFP
jgi:pyruvate formate lyase activating enzyme